ncbi:hypothetical protein [Moritella sp. F3]|uniref:hypothetical protein n=1 Tax=Moritella sp. F3 TaxID=2718882 RepID=UPI0018E0D37D|nr:hypothetical protein [Moritella sp. F3]GIC77143.1 hypothetical protein FMO001_18700 [Moritella sp. F1]GIC82262.1 hypothetical protein FMO003_25430 [Moritella sp. F3]
MKKLIILLAFLAMPTMANETESSTSATLLNAILIRIGDEPRSALFKSENGCGYLVEATSLTLSEIILKPIKKVCDSVEGDLPEQKIIVASSVMESSITGEKVNQLKPPFELHLSE